MSNAVSLTLINLSHHFNWILVFTIKMGKKAKEQHSPSLLVSDSFIFGDYHKQLHKQLNEKNMLSKCKEPNPSAALWN